MLKIDLVTADGSEERSHTRACRELASTKFVNRLNTGFASVNTVVGCGDWIIKGEKCLTDSAIDSASTSQGSQVTWCFRNLALKKPAKWS